MYCRGRSCVSRGSTRSGQRRRAWSFSFSLALARACVFPIPTPVSSLWQSFLLTASEKNNPSTAPRARHVQCTPGRRRPVFSSNSTSSLFQQKRSFWRLPRRMFEACVSFCTQPAVITTIKSFQCFPMILCERMVPKCGSGTFMNLTSEKLSTASAIRK